MMAPVYQGGTMHAKTLVLQSVGVVAVLSAVLAAQESTRASATEITKTDVTNIEKVRSTNLMLFGVALGDKFSEAEEKARSAGFVVKSEALTRRAGHLARVFDSSGKESWGFSDESGTVTEIIVRSDLAPRLPGESSKLFDPTIMDAESPLRLRLFGREDNRTVERPAASMTTITISYDKEGIRFTQSNLGGGRNLPPTVLFITPAKSR
jgi:hypothetical protein